MLTATINAKKTFQFNQECKGRRIAQIIFFVLDVSIRCLQRFTMHLLMMAVARVIQVVRTRECTYTRIRLAVS
jgi:hypothetical protein